MSKFLLVDASHLFHRAKHAVRGNQSEKVGMCLHILFNSLSKAWRTQNAEHIVFAFDGSSWRKEVYAPYKANRKVLYESYSPTEVAESNLFFEAFDIFREFIKTKTNCTVLEHDKLEADDLISGFIQVHPNDQHTIVSSDADFIQLLAPNVILYNGVDDITLTLSGIFDYKGKPVMDKKTGKPKSPPDPQWSVFEKCVRGCTTDNIFSAYPGIREKGTKKTVGLKDAFIDRDKKGFDWNALMLHRWTDHNNKEHRVLDDYCRNQQLVDLTAQPDDIKKLIQETLSKNCVPLDRKQIGPFFLKMCGKFELQKLSERFKDFAVMLSSKYTQDVREINQIRVGKENTSISYRSIKGFS